MSTISNSSANIIIFLLILVQIFELRNVAGSANKNNTLANYTDVKYLITGGGYRPEKPNSLTKYLVSLRTFFYEQHFGSDHFCGGCIIGARIILTAAHCLKSSTLSPTRSIHTVRIVAKSPNRLNRTADTAIMKVANIRIHPSFDRNTFANDIAIIKLEKSIKLDDQLAQIIQLANGTAEPGTHCTIIGWGRLILNGPLAAEAIYADIDIIPTDTCKMFTHFEAGMLCAANLKDLALDACTGDSGGPLICQLKLVGLVSHGVGCAIGIPGIYTDVSYYRKWIEENQSCCHKGSIKLNISLVILILFYKCYIEFLFS